MNPFGIIHAEKADFPVRILCRLMGVSHAGYYAWRGRGPSQRQRSEERIVTKMRAIQARTKQSYGAPRMHDELHDDGENVGRHRIARLMREHGLCALVKRRFVRTTDSKHDRPLAPNLLERNFRTNGPNRVWVGDITYLRTRQGWVYLAVLMDLYSRAIVGWSLDTSLHRRGALAALKQAIGWRQPQPGLVHHTDRGCQFASDEYRDVLRHHQAIQSMSRAGDCYDNAVAESFFASFKKERVRGRILESYDHAYRLVSQYIDGFYNLHRRHSHNRGLSPFDFEAIAQTQHVAPIAASLT